MPAFGSRTGESMLEGAPNVANLDTEPWEMTDVQILNLLFEVNEDSSEALLPKALHPTIPPIVYFSLHKFADSPVGPFSLAQARVGCRAGVRPRGFLTKSYTDSPEAAEALAARWGFTCKVADVALHRYHDRVSMIVTDGGRTILDAGLITPEPISGSDVQYVANMQLANFAGTPTLLQVDPEFTFKKAERGRPNVSTFDAAAWDAPGLRVTWPVSASFAVADTGFPAIRYVVNPDVPALASSRKVGAA
jgi:Acetoacetate decarboxylase (ADC)